MSPGRRSRLLGRLGIAGAALLAGGATVLSLQLLLASRIERAALRRISQTTALSLRLSDLALERYPREAVASISGLELVAAPPVPPGSPVPPQLRRQGAWLRAALCAELEACPRLLLQAQPVPGAWVELPSALEPSWLFAPLPRLRLWPPAPPVWSLGLLAGTLVAITLHLELEVRRPLARLRRSIQRLDPAQPRRPVPVQGSRAVRQLTERFNAMVERLERHRRERATMLEGLAHDLRTPVTRLQLRLALAGQRPLAGREAERAQADLDAISRITRQFTAFAAGESPEQPLEVDLAELVGQSLAGMEEELALDLPPLRRCVQPVALSRAVANLVENALHHGRPPLRVSLEPWGDGRAGATPGFLIRVADCGAGIPAERWEQALEPFQRLDPSRGGSGHCGLGLAISRVVARAHGGELRRRPLQPGGGHPQTFAVELLGRSHPVTTPLEPVTARSQPSPSLDPS